MPRADLKGQVAGDIRAIFNAPTRVEAERLLEQTVERCRPSASRLATWLEETIPEGLTVFSFPEPHRRRLRTTNLLERINQELRRRTRVVGIFPNPASCLRLVSALHQECDEEWLAGRTYLTFRE